MAIAAENSNHMSQNFVLNFSDLSIYSSSGICHCWIRYWRKEEKRLNRKSQFWEADLVFWKSVVWKTWPKIDQVDWIRRLRKMTKLQPLLHLWTNEFYLCPGVSFQLNDVKFAYGKEFCFELFFQRWWSNFLAAFVRSSNWSPCGLLRHTWLAEVPQKNSLWVPPLWKKDKSKNEAFMTKEGQGLEQ